LPQERRDLLDLAPVRLDLLCVFRLRTVCLLLVALTVPVDDPFRHTLQLLPLLLQLAVSPAPLLGGIRRQLAAIHREVLLADQTQLRGVQQHIPKQPHDLAVELPDEARQRREVRPGVGRQRHEQPRSAGTPRPASGWK